jgi:serine/threonine protein kinase
MLEFATSVAGKLVHNAEQQIPILPNTNVNPTGHILGQGAYGDVLEVEYKGKIYAAKKYRTVKVHSLLGGSLHPLLGGSLHSLLGAFAREHDIMTRIRHPNLVPYYGICKLAGDRSTVIIMERLEMNLGTFLGVNMQFERKVQILNDVVQGLHHLHSQRPAIIHRDLTASNVLLNANGTAKISDFGNSRMVDWATPELLTSDPGTLDYMPPEALEGGEYNDKLDIFSFGHLSIHVIIQCRPHPLLRNTRREAGRLIPQTEVERRQRYLDEVKSKLIGGESHPLYSLIISCLEDELSQRPSAADILRHSPFAELNT